MAVNNTWDADEPMDETTPLVSPLLTSRPDSARCKQGINMPRAKNVLTQFWKNVTRLRRNLPLLVFSFIMPSIQITLYFLAIGRNPTGLHMAVVNDDVGCFNHSLSEAYLSFINSDTIIQTRCATYSEALAKVHNGDAWGIYQFGANFTCDLAARYSGQPSLAQLAGSQVQLSLDYSNQQIAFSIQQCTTDAFQALAQSFLGPDASEALLPLALEPPLYGPAHPTFTDFVAPGIMITISFAQAIALTAVAFVVDRKEGLLDRTWSMGALPSEIILGHTLAQLLIIAGQVTLMLIIALLAFNLPIYGSLGLVVLLMGLLGIAGMLYGLCVSTVSPEESQAMQLALGSFFPVLLLSGVIWPLEAIPVPLSYVSLGLPTTWAAAAMRSVLLRGWDATHSSVWQALLVVTGWIALFLVLSVRGVNRID